MLQSWRRDALSCIWIIVLVAMAYGLALRNGYVWDDRYFLTDYAWIGSYGDALRSSLLPLFNQASYFRPLPLFSLYAEAIASDRNPAVAHGVALAWHAAAAILVYLLARRAVLAMQPQGAVQIARAGDACAVFVDRPLCRLAYVWMCCQAEVIVGADHDDRPAPDRYLGSFGAIQGNKIGIEPAFARCACSLHAWITRYLFENIHGSLTSPGAL